MIAPAQTLLPNSLVVLDEVNVPRLYGSNALGEIARRTNLLSGPIAPTALPSRSDLWGETEVLFTGWGCPRMDAALLRDAPKLKAIFFAGGTIRTWATPAVWERGLVVSSGYGVNAIPVADFTLAAILLSLKRGWHYLGHQQRTASYPVVERECPGTYLSRVGLVSLGVIGRRVRERLRPFDLEVMAYDPFMEPQEAERLGVRALSLESLFETCDVISLHTPLLPETEGLISGDLLRRMKPGATLINTARGGIVRETEMLAVLSERRDLTAVLDVLQEEPPEPGHPLLALPNAFITPHIAGSQGAECLRLGATMIEEYVRWRAGSPLLWQITPEKAPLLA